MTRNRYERMKVSVRLVFETPSNFVIVALITLVLIYQTPCWKLSEITHVISEFNHCHPSKEWIQFRSFKSPAN